MRELSLNVMDIVQNSISAGATVIKISVLEEVQTLTIVITDNGRGMSKEQDEEKEADAHQNLIQSMP